MIQFLETIRLVNGVLQHIDLHQQRVNNTLRAYYNEKIDLSSIKIPYPYKEGVFKCRIVYDKKIQEIKFIPYTINIRKTVKLIINNNINYQYKYANRTELDSLLHNANTDDIIIIKNGFLTDSAYANIILQNSNGLFTPAHPLLYGTMRQYLLNKNFIISKDIHINNLSYFQYIYFINAMQPFGSQPPIYVKDIIL